MEFVKTLVAISRRKKPFVAYDDNVKRDIHLHHYHRYVACRMTGP